MNQHIDPTTAALIAKQGLIEQLIILIISNLETAGLAQEREWFLKELEGFVSRASEQAGPDVSHQLQLQLQHIQRLFE